MTGRTITGVSDSRLRRLIARHPAGLHRLSDPAYLLSSDLPAAAAAVLRQCDGAELFHETIILRPSARIELCRPPLPAVAGSGPVYWVGEIAGDDLYVDLRGRVYRSESDTGEWLAEGSRFDRWLLGAVAAEAVLYDDDGEFAADRFDESGELSPKAVVRTCRRVLDHDADAPGPRWRLARALVRLGDVERARDELETVVAGRPDFAWAWFDLAQISEQLGQPGAALDELCAAAEAIPAYEHAGFLWAHAARVAHAMGDEPRRAELAGRALDRDPGLVRAQRDGARATLRGAEDEDDGDPRAALSLAELAAALAPRDIETLDLLRQIRAALQRQGG
ncbi:MAG: tetratricopeptide repeat protein [Myxococcota bacterium]